ncbi:MAG: hypothetical protein CMG46_07380 [Candidatus Marinimicrobia bacterium]|nr:hypothetical protein [Candidatus Neomarinimicrobiota bacterium]
MASLTRLRASMHQSLALIRSENNQVPKAILPRIGTFILGYPTRKAHLPTRMQGLLEVLPLSD